MGAMVSINRLLEQTVEHLEAGNPEQAEATLDVLDFERLLHPIKGSGAEHRFVDPAASFGVERVHETGDHVRSCIAALAAGDFEAALEAARAAAARWAKV